MALKRIYTSRDGMEAHFLRALLEREGIAATVMGETLANALGTLPLGSATAPTVWVNQEDLERASNIVATFDRKAARKLSTAVSDVWTCPNCQEVIEAQFTDCWNCQTPRPSADAATASKELHPIDPTLQSDLACVSCKYNLRGLTPGHVCPECGTPMLFSMFHVLRESDPTNATELHRLMDEPFRVAASKVGHPAAALMLICYACMRAVQQIQTAPEPIGVDANRIWMSIRQHAIEDFGGPEQARVGLHAWGIRSREEVARIIIVLMDAGLLQRGNWFDSGQFQGELNLDEK